MCKTDKNYSNGFKNSSIEGRLNPLSDVTIDVTQGDYQL